MTSVIPPVVCIPKQRAQCHYHPTVNRSLIQTHPWPERVDGNISWDGNDSCDGDRFTTSLSVSVTTEIHLALQHFHGLQKYGSEVSKKSFPLPTLGKTLESLASVLHMGEGVALIRGLDPDCFSHEDNIIVFMGISSYLSPVRGQQDEKGNMLVHISNTKRSLVPEDERPTKYSRRASTFHTDAFCDILALQTRTCAARGGRNLLASSSTIYNKIRTRRPDILPLLAAPNWPFESQGSMFKSGNRPLLYYHDGRIILNYAREPLLGLDGVCRTPELGELTVEQLEALDFLEEMAQESQVSVDTIPGDLLFVNNHGILHSREAFEDNGVAKESRYVIRMWLKHPKLCWQLPHALQEGNDRIYRTDLCERWNVMDTPKKRFDLSERLQS